MRVRTSSSSRRIEAGSPRMNPSSSPAASTSRASDRTRSVVSWVASAMATLRNAKKPPTMMTAIAATLPSMNCATAAPTLGGADVPSARGHGRRRTLLVSVRTGQQ